MRLVPDAKKSIIGAVLIYVLGLALFIGACAAEISTDFDNLVDQIKQEESFISKPYRDSRGFLTLGYGTNIQEGITRIEGDLLLRERLKKASDGLAEAWKPFKSQTLKIRAALSDMSYQLGVHGVLEFKDMLSALAVKNYQKAANAAENSKWFKETPNRAKRVIAVIESHI